MNVTSKSKRVIICKSLTHIKLLTLCLWFSADCRSWSSLHAIPNSVFLFQTLLHLWKHFLSMQRFMAVSLKAPLWMMYSLIWWRIIWRIKLQRRGNWHQRRRITLNEKYCDPMWQIMMIKHKGPYWNWADLWGYWLLKYPNCLK